MRIWILDIGFGMKQKAAAYLSNMAFIFSICFPAGLEKVNYKCLPIQRPGDKRTIIDRVQATVLYEGGIVNFYHGFDQPEILDRQEMRLQFEHGEITLYEWVPVKCNCMGCYKGQLERLKEFIGASSIVHDKEQMQVIKK